MSSAALCGSALADGEEIRNFLWKRIKGAAAFKDSVLTEVDIHFIIMCTLIPFDFPPPTPTDFFTHSILRIETGMFEEIGKGKAFLYFLLID